MKRLFKKQIVIVDDDLPVLSSLERMLEDYDVKSFSDPKQALYYFRCPNEANLAIIDVIMPEIDGISLLKEIKANNDIPVIVVTAHASRSVSDKALRHNAECLMEKPLDMYLLKEKIETLMAEAEGPEVSLANSSDKVGSIKKFVEQNYRNASLAFIAQEMCMSPKYLSRMFNEKNDQSFRDYLLHVRIDKAKELLQSSVFNINEISFQLGYQNPESFMRIFKKSTKLTPMQYRKTHKAKTAKTHKK